MPQIYIGGDVYGEEMLQDEPEAPRDSSWLMYPGAAVDLVCDSSVQALQFAGKNTVSFCLLVSNSTC